MATQIKRRYRDNRLPEHSIYSKSFDLALQNSKVFNADQIVSIHSIIWDETGIKTEIQILEKATIPALHEKLQLCEASFESYCTQRENAGYERPTTWPPHLLKDRCQMEARLDVSLRELEFLRAKLQTLYVEPQRKKQNDNMLAYGPVGSGRLSGGTLVEIDGQETGFVDTVLIITAEGSPFRGMRIKDYREFVVKPYCEERNRRLRRLTDQRMIEIREHGSTNIPPLPLSRGKIDKSSLPTWPTGVRNYLKPEEEPKTETGDENL